MSDTTHGVFLTVTEGGAIITKTPALPDGPAQYALLHKLLGGYLECFYQMPSHEGRGRMIQFYCDEDGLSKGLPYNLTIHGGTQIVGPVLIVAAKAPEMYGLTEGEASAIADLMRGVAHTGRPRSEGT